MRFKGYLGENDYDIVVEPVEGGYRVSLGESVHHVDTTPLEASCYSLLIDGRSYEVSVRAGEHDQLAVHHEGNVHHVRIVDPLAAAASASFAGSGTAEVRAVMPGRVVKALVREADQVVEGQGLVVLEAMKMENE
ncbi:MAG: hypothetical protein JSV80_06845, partial [Acidobacteriota bacterium]